MKDNIINILFRSWVGVLIHSFLAIIIGYSILSNFFNDELAEITNHGQEFAVPNLENLTVEEAENKLKELELTLEIKDTIYSEKHAPGTIITQHPQVNSNVKANRHIYVSLNSGDIPKITITEETLHKLVKSDINDVIVQTSALGFKYSIDSVKHKYKDYVLDTKYKGSSIKVGDIIQKGARLTLEVGNGSAEETDSTDSVLID